MTRKIKFETFTSRVKERFGDNFFFSEADYSGLKEPIVVRCQIHNISIKVRSAVQVTIGNPCELCVRENKFRKYISKVLESLEENYPQFKLLGEITGFNCMVKLYCPKHGEFQQKTDSIIFNRSGCSKCGVEKRTEKLKGRIRISLEMFKLRFKDRYGEQLSLVNVENDFESINSLITATCSNPAHQPFTLTGHNHLRYQGCRQCNESCGERLVRCALEDLGIEYEQEKRFSSCRDKKELPFDFWLPRFSTLIEFQGKQHEVPADFFGGIRALSGVKRRDKIKNDWAKENDINLIYLSDYQNVKKTILTKLHPIKDFNPEHLLQRVMESESKWTDEKWQYYLKELNQKHKGNYDFSKSSWVWGQKNISYICKTHGVRSGNLLNLIKGHGCAICSGNEIRVEDVIARSKEQFGDNFDFSKSVFVSTVEEIEFSCKNHGVIRLTPERHLRLVKGCPLCSEKSLDFSPEKFLKEAKGMFGDRFDYSELGYKNSTSKVIIRCKEHRVQFETLPSDHLRYSTGCCSECVRESKSETHSKSIVVEGKKFNSFIEAANHYGLSRSIVQARIRRGWNIDRSFITPKK